MEILHKIFRFIDSPKIRRYENIWHIFSPDSHGQKQNNVCPLNIAENGQFAPDLSFLVFSHTSITCLVI